MLKNKDMICISASDWLKPWGSKQHLMSRLSEYNRVLYVEYQASMLDFIKYPGYFIKRLGNLNKLQKLSRNLYVYTPVLLLPFGYYFNCINILNQRILKKHLLKIIKGLGFEDIILWIYPSSSLALIGNMTERLSVYHCIASFSDEKKNPLRKRMIQRLENDMARRVNIIFTLTKTLCGRFKKINPNTFYFPSAVDIGHYENILSGNTQEPQDMILVKKPRIGIIGYLNGNIMDIGLIEYLADYKKDWSIVMIGPVFKGWGKMKKLK
ncbi:MAG: hypothetical protein KKB22_04170, partial [Candidatus Omnitrophica bacterium]|nr:hypothetical protein [Candidatus Omnitrophota bacterium]